MPVKVETYDRTEEAARALASSRSAKFFGGGTLVMRAVNAGDQSFDTIIRLRDPSFRTIRAEGDGIVIGAGATMAAVAANRDLAFLAPVARIVGGPAIRNMATVGGNLFAPTPYGDFTVALLALDATVHTGDAAMPIEQFLGQRDSTHAIVTSVSFALPGEGKFRFLKVSRVKPKGISVLSLAAVLEEGADGTVASARIALGCMADRPIRAKAAERALLGQKRTKEGIAPALALANEGTSPATDAIASAWYRAEVLPVHLGRLLLA